MPQGLDRPGGKGAPCRSVVLLRVKANIPGVTEEVGPRFYAGFVLLRPPQNYPVTSTRAPWGRSGFPLLKASAPRRSVGSGDICRDSSDT